ncbi:helix-turn-helix domain-containing protein [Acidithiobacillus thiooxidans]|uniref:helix-turn-helix domain-containing protein n=1 Tax=Acidithiobacillus thiooxidans TaxID=930 RepID=UPI001C07143D|nr:helix-turn-helix domain-containing protein [Acidithiobacillus thiooxidans]MBU2839501.1 helix-turn-helix domain-containing protein [Acidithiobacillus thiooxidans]MBU2841879.1 helix-turn-helix domain-containing protein [Acidithiobacillus thiooxidans]
MDIANTENVITDRLQFGRMVRQLRKAQSITQAEMAQKMGVSKATVIALEHWESAVPFDQLLQVCDLLKMELSAQFKASAQVVEKVRTIESENAQPWVRGKRFPNIFEVMASTALLGISHNG